MPGGRFIGSLGQVDTSLDNWPSECFLIIDGAINCRFTLLCLRLDRVTVWSHPKLLDTHTDYLFIIIFDRGTLNLEIL